MKKIKIIILSFFIGLACFNAINFTRLTSTQNSVINLLKISTANAEILDPINVRFWGLPDVRTCVYWTNTITGQITISLTNPGGSGSVSWVQHVGTKTLCDNWTNDPCDYIACH
jgi:hypothetical protein